MPDNIDHTGLDNHHDKCETVVDRIRYIMSSQHLTQAAMARKLGVDSAYMSKIMTRKIPVSDGFINRMVIDLGVSRKWLKDGNDLPYAKPSHTETIEAQIVPTDHKRGTGIPVYDIDVTAGNAELSRMLTLDRIMGYVDMPQVNPECLIVRVSGDSMKPSIGNGSFIAIRPVSTSGVIFWGQIYVVVTESYRMVKYLRKNENPDYVTLHSDNPNYDDIDMPRSEIKSLFIVETVINYERRC
ncbi:MAG: XRE family transcriptional regulator [Ruminococcus flavefaciens]|nr:XRE family transcriptional regulator [Ruminococcus flavefaciens]